MTYERYLCRIVPLVLAAGLLSGCDDNSRFQRAAMESQIIDDIRSGKAPPPAFVDMPVISFDGTGKPGIAVSHTFAIEVPGGRVEELQKQHLAECAKLGCKVMSTGMNRWDTAVQASSSVRLSPVEFDRFVGVISAAPATITSRTETAEDQALPILEADNRLAVKTALRDKLKGMLTEPGDKSPADLAAIEKELAQVQGDIEAITAQQRHLRTITETVLVDVTYQGADNEPAGLDFAPLVRAAAGISQTIIGSAAYLVSFLASLVPWLPLIALLIWACRSGLRRWRRSQVTA